MAIQTVMGPICQEEVGFTLMHEHIFMDLRKKFDQTDLKQTDELVTKEKIPILRKNHRLLKDNLFLADEETALSEIELYRDLGGKTIVNMSNRGMGSNPLKLKKISEETGVNIIECTGFYTAATHPEWMWNYTVNQLSDVMIRDIIDGIDDTGIQAGIIGEIGTSAEITDREYRVLEGAVIAQKETNASISIHIDPWVENGMTVLRFLEKNRADLTKVIIDHVDAVINLNYCRELLKTGAVIEFENFGKNYETPGLHFDTDEQRVNAISTLIEDGYDDQIVISSDVCLKTDLYQFGGGGYSHIPRTIVPMFMSNGINAGVIKKITEQNPRRLLNK